MFTKHVGFAALFLAISPAAPARAKQKTDEIRLTIQADDLGAGHGINVAAIEAYKMGIVRTANVLIPAPWAPEAAQLLNENPGLEAGVHLTLTSEWPTIKWRPLTLATNLMDPNGYFYPAVRGRAGNSVVDAKPKIEEIETELRAQIVLAKKMIPHVAYFSSHMGFSSMSPEVTALVQKLSKEYGLIWPERDVPSQSLGQIWARGDTVEVQIDKFAAKLASLTPGTWFMLEHPATNTPEIQAFGGRVAADRDAIRRIWTSPKVLDVVKRRGIRLTNNRDGYLSKP